MVVVLCTMVGVGDMNTGKNLTRKEGREGGDRRQNPTTAQVTSTVLSVV